MRASRTNLKQSDARKGGNATDGGHKSAGHERR